MNQTTIKELQNLLDGKSVDDYKRLDSDLKNTLEYLRGIGIVEYDKLRFEYSINPNNSDSSKHLQKLIELNNLDKFKKYYINYNPNKKSVWQTIADAIAVLGTLETISSSIIQHIPFDKIVTIFHKLK